MIRRLDDDYLLPVELSGRNPPRLKLQGLDHRCWNFLVIRRVVVAAFGTTEPKLQHPLRSNVSVLRWLKIEKKREIYEIYIKKKKKLERDEEKKKKFG